jgi:hypothetical protein
MPLGTLIAGMPEAGSDEVSIPTAQQLVPPPSL